MCLGVPMRVIEVVAGHARCVGDDAGAPALVDIALVAPVAAGDWLLVHLGIARERLDEERAAQIRSALGSLAALLRGQGFDESGFADLIGREPALPPHLEAARRAGAKEA
jgi:hydrogenase expression/formation protein HypC